MLELLTTLQFGRKLAFMKAELLLFERVIVAEAAFADIRIWRVPEAVRGSGHAYKYALAFVVEGVCVVRYDNEAGKGDHVHEGGAERPYPFTTPERLLTDFWTSVDTWRAP